jgi:nucleotidyltransferase/DNA polymerase involved in DNA repair
MNMMARGIDKSEVEEGEDIKSSSRDLTFQEDTSDQDLIFKMLDELSGQVHTDISKQGFYFKTVTVRVRYENFETHTHSKTLPLITNNLAELKETARELIKPYFKPDRKIRLISVRVSNFTSTIKQKTLV